MLTHQTTYIISLHPQNNLGEVVKDHRTSSKCWILASERCEGNICILFTTESPAPGLKPASQ